MSSLAYSRMLVIWMTIGMILLNGYLLFEVLSTPFDGVYLFLGWLFLGLDLLAFFGFSRLWNTEMEL